jgi:hypothetical protein
VKQLLILIPLIISLLGCGGVTASTHDFTLNEYNKCQPGMDYQDVVKILGSEGSEYGSTFDKNSDIKLYEWKGSNGIVQMSFKKGKLVSKTEYLEK